MEKYCVLINPKANSGHGAESADKLKALLPEALIRCEDVTAITDMKAFLSDLPADETPVLTGGDGTINRFVNSLDGEAPARDILYFAAGTGNDFLNDLGKTVADGPFLLNPYLVNLPVVVVNGGTYYFINGIGYGIDGYCCEVGDKMRETSDKPVNYTSIAIKGLLFHYKRTNADVTVDGVTKHFKHVWLSPTMHGRYYGGGMICTPAQDRLSDKHTVSAMTMTGMSKIKTLLVFSTIFKGEHIKHTEMVTITEGSEVTVKFDRPTALQIDGETVTGVSEYTVYSVNSPKHPKYAADKVAAAV